MTISGAGPSLFIAVEPGMEEDVADKLAVRFPYYECLAIKPSVTGTRIK